MNRHEEPADGPGKVDAAELLSAVGTFLAALTAFVSVGVILLRADPHLSLTSMVMAGMDRRREHADRRRGHRALARPIGRGFYVPFSPAREDWNRRQPFECAPASWSRAFFR